MQDSQLLNDKNSTKYLKR